jgi:hypothetical protein
VDELVGLVCYYFRGLSVEYAEMLGQVFLLCPMSIRLSPQGIPTAAFGSELNDTGFSQRRVMAGLSKVDRKMARPSEDRSPAEV